MEQSKIQAIEYALQLSRRAGRTFAMAEKHIGLARQHREDPAMASALVEIARDFNRTGVTFMRLAREAVSR